MMKSYLKTTEAWSYMFAGREFNVEYQPMYFELAYNIWYAREHLGLSWRGVANYITKGEDDNQMLGMWLCRHAAMFFGEEWE